MARHDGVDAQPPCLPGAARRRRARAAARDPRRAVPADRKEAAREGLLRAAREADLGATPLWARVNSLESPWVLDDLTTLVGEAGNRIDVVMVPKVEGPWDIHYV